MGSPNVPKQSRKSKEAERLQIQLYKKELRNSEKFEMPEIAVPDPVKPPPPPPAATGADVFMAGQYAKVQAQKKMGVGRSVYAGSNNALGGASLSLG